MDQDFANQKYKEWGAILLLDAPEQIELGIDNTSWTIGKKFKGIKLVPPGPHIVYYSLKSEQHKFRLFFFVNITKKNRVIVKKWNEKLDDFISVQEDERQRYEHGVDDFSLDEFLGPYPGDRYQLWQEISNYIDDKVLEKLNPIEKRMHLIEDEYKNEALQKQEEKLQMEKLTEDLYGQDFGFNQEEDDENLDYEGEAGGDENLEELEKKLKEKANIKDGEKSSQNQNQKINQKDINKQNKKQLEKEFKKYYDQNQAEDFKVLAGTIYYTEIPKKKIVHGMSAQQITDQNFDKSEIFKSLLKMNFNNDYKMFFGEFQYAFASFLLGEDFDSFEQWKDMFLLCTNVDKYIFEQGNIQYAIDLVPVLYGMLKQFPRDFFIDNISKDNFIKKSLMEFIQVCAEENENKKLINRAKKLQEMLEHKFLFFPSNKIIEKNDGEYQYEMDDEDTPNIVDLNQQFISF